MASYAEGMEFARPTPLHAITPAALAAVEAHRVAAARTRLDRVMAQIVTDVGRPQRIPYDGERITSGARSLLALGEEHGFASRVHELHEGCMVEGLHRSERVGWRAWWIAGATGGASWHEPLRFEMVDDTRPIGMDATARVGKKGHRSTGMGTRRLSQVASPAGVPMNVTALRKRIEGYHA